MLGKNSKLTPSQAFGVALRDLRKKAGLTQEALAFEADIERNYVSLIELGRNQPTVNMIFKLAGALNTKPSRLMTATEKILAE